MKIVPFCVLCAQDVQNRKVGGVASNFPLFAIWNGICRRCFCPWEHTVEWSINRWIFI